MKRCFDFFVSFTLLLFVSPVLIFLAIIVRITLGAPIFFIQVRSGLYGIPFKIVKFRSMVHACASDGALLSDSERLSRFGRFLRVTSLDELPSLWNVLKGDMSLIGPRPLLMEYLPLYSAEQFRRHEVRPGITGWAQINGRNSISWQEKFTLDVWYVDHHSFLLDLKILWLTFGRVLQRRGINADGEATAPKFTGNN